MSINKSRKIYYSMGEVAEMLDVGTTTIRFWESRFTILKPHRNKKGNRMFTPVDVENLKLIYHLVKQQGMTLEGASKALTNNRDDVVRKAEIVERLLTVKSMLLEIKQELSGDDTDAFDPQEEYIEPAFLVQQEIVFEDTEEVEPEDEDDTLVEDNANDDDTAPADEEDTDEEDSDDDAQDADGNNISFENQSEAREQTLF